MLHVRFCEEQPDSQALCRATRNAHVKYFGARQEVIRLAGPMPGDDDERMVGPLFLVEAEHIDLIRDLHRDDPYTLAGLGSGVALHRFRQVITAS